MAPLKAPGLDGMLTIFLSIIGIILGGGDISQVILSVLNFEKFPADLNHTFLTLIPKGKCPGRVSDFHPIALCNILYKLVSKVLVNRLKKILLDIIFDTQSAFQFDKATSDNILVAFETLHHMKAKKSGKSGFMTLKLDMSKAYNRVEWSFLLKIREKMGFHTR